MLFNPLSPTIPHIAYACLGGFVVIFGMFSLFIREKLYIGEACWAFLFGVIIGPYGAGIFDPRGWANGNDEVSNTITLEFTRVVLAIGVFAIGVELPKAYVARHWKSLFFLLGPVMAWGWFVSAGLIYAFVPGLDFLSSLAVGACLTPTDPILAAAVVGGKYADKHVPAHIRHLLSAEAGCNDGAAYPFLFLALYLILDRTPGITVEDWFLHLWLFEIALSVVFGSILGFAFRHLMKFCERNDLIDRQSYVAQYVSLAFLTIGIMTILGSDDLLAAFCCGASFAWDGFFNRQTEEAVFSSVIDLLFNVASFVYVGAWMPFDSFSNDTLTLSVGHLILTAILIFLLKRLPIMMALYKFIPDVKTFREALFSGHFGPVGIGAVYISTLAVGYLPKPSNPPANQTEFLASAIQPIVAFIVLCSVLIHGLSIPFFSLGRRVHSVSSRTWSRHATGPDWATHTRHITRAEDVVINRDGHLDAMEKGRAGLAEDENTIMESRRPSVEAKTPHEEGNHKTEEMVKDDDSAKGQTPPDGTELSMMWKEGSDEVIERRAGPGEEVDVTVVHRTHKREDSPPSFVGPLRIVHSWVHHLHHPSDGAPRNAGHLEEACTRIEPQKESSISSVSAVTHMEEEPESGGVSEGGANGTTDVFPVTMALGEERRRVGSDKGKAPIRPGNTKKNKEDQWPSTADEQALCVYPPSSDTTPTLSQSVLTTEPEQVQDVPEDADQRGRSTRHVGKGGSLSSRPSMPSLQHKRLESLRLAQHSRDTSPARSIRFADERFSSGTSTPRNGALQNEPWLSSNQVDDSPMDEDAETGRGKVTFDLSAKH